MQSQELFDVLGMQQRIKETRFYSREAYISDFLNIVFTPRNPEAKTHPKGLKKAQEMLSSPTFCCTVFSGSHKAKRKTLKVPP